jgi:hypothetical protein
MKPFTGATFSLSCHPHQIRPFRPMSLAYFPERLQRIWSDVCFTSLPVSREAMMRIILFIKC